MYYQLHYPKWVKLDTLLKTTVNKAKINTILLQKVLKKTKIKTTGLPPAKRFLYSHIARLHTLFLRGVEFMWALHLVDHLFIPWEVFHALIMRELKLHIALL